VHHSKHPKEDGDVSYKLAGNLSQFQHSSKAVRNIAKGILYTATIAKQGKDYLC